MRATPSQRRVVAVVGRAYDAYQRGIVSSIREHLANAGYGTVCLMEGDQSAFASTLESGIDRDANLRFGWIAEASQIEGVILLSGLLGNKLPNESFQRSVDPIAQSGLPVVSLGLVIPGIASVALESTDSLVALMEHMTLDPQRSHFAFIQGHASGAESAERERVFRQVLSRRGIPIDENLVFPGHFVSADAYAEMAQRLASGCQVDAVVAANDLMASAAIMALQDHGLSVPEDVIVSGFDDAPRSIESQPPLTTISQHVDQQALCAAELLLELMADRQSPAAAKHVLIDTELVIRRSSNPGFRQASSLTQPLTVKAPERVPESSQQWFVRRLNSVLPPQGIDVDTIASALFAKLDGTDDSWNKALDEMLKQSTRSGRDGRWSQHLAAQLDTLLERIDTRRRPLLRAAIAHLESRLQMARSRDRFERGVQRLRHDRLLLQLAACPDKTTIWQTLEAALPRLGVTRAWILLEENSQSKQQGWRLAFSLDGASRDNSRSEFVSYSDLLPARLATELESGLLILMPLLVGDARHMGQLLIDPGHSTTLELGSIAAGLSQALARTDDALALRDSNRSLIRVAHYDPLTGLQNRNRFQKTLDSTLLAADQSGEGVALLFLDLDGFKLINDTLGHGAGDQLLCIIASRIDRVLRDEDVLARLGGDEFTVLITRGCDFDGIKRVATDIIDAVGKPCKLDKRLVDISVSIGVARYPSDGNDAETLLRNADTSMYHAKAAGKNRYSLYQPEFNAEAIARLELLDDLRNGISAGEFRMHYQPRVNLDTGELVAFEALMRWRRGRDGEDIGPDRFIPVAEESGLVNILDTFALKTVCEQGSKWAACGISLPVSINLSMRCLQEQDIVERVRSALNEHDLHPSFLELEITESAAMNDVERSIEKVTALRKLGVQIAIDDFGTGYSSLSYLQRLPVTSLKIDRAFFKSVSAEDTADSADVAIVSAVVALGAALGFRIVAEGIENDAQHLLARELSCDEGQGWLFGRALPVETATELLYERQSRPVLTIVSG